jgi:methionyl-tRNA synthetase
MTRDLEWGVPVPVEGANGKVLYVWFDAPIGYISATKELLPDSWKDYWMDKESRLIHFIGKDNIVFHCIIFPAMLMEHGNFIVADNVPANEFLNLEGDKISTSRNWAVWLHEYLTEFKDKQDVLRYTLCANAPETKDNDFTWKDFQTRNNSELVAILGNFVNRTLVLTQKYYNGIVPKAEIYTKDDLAVLSEIERAPTTISQPLEQFKFRDGLSAMMNLARVGNKYLADTEPWKLIKTDEERVKTILNVSIQICASLSIVMEPFMPFSAAKLRKMLNFKGFDWKSAAKTNLLSDGHQMGEAVLLFDKIEDETIHTQLNKLAESKKQNELASKTALPQKDIITFDEFAKMDIRVGTVLDAVKVPKADKLLQLTIDTGIDKRTVVSGIAQYYKPEDIIGKQISILVNLAPRKIKGIESQGMILMAENLQGELTLVSPVIKTNNGSIIK